MTTKPIALRLKEALELMAQVMGPEEEWPNPLPMYPLYDNMSPSERANAIQSNAMREQWNREHAQGS